MDSELGKRCGRCRRIRPSRIYYREIKGLQPKRFPGRHRDWMAVQYRKICQECWQELETLRREV